MPSSSQPSNVPSAIAGMSAVLCRKKTHEQRMTRAQSHHRGFEKVTTWFL